MADLEQIDLAPMRYNPEIGECVPVGGHITRELPQIFWSDGSPWEAACQFALSQLRDSAKNIKTVVSSMGHLKHYASWLEREQADWRDFPMRKRDRCLFRYRGFLVEQRDCGFLSPSTTAARMAAVIRFYRWAQAYRWIERKELWEDQQKAIKFHTTVGLQRTMAVMSSELSIPNRRIAGLTVEGGLIPITVENRDLLLRFLADREAVELHLMFLLGFFTGARSETIRTLRLSSLNSAIEDDSHPGMSLITVGPGSGVKTKYGVPGQLKIATPLMNALEQYAFSPRRAFRQARATGDDKGVLFLTERGNPYSETSFTKLISRLREQLSDAGLNQFRQLKFHQSRATFGTQLMTVAMEKLASTGDAIRFVRDAMFHKDERTTWKYVKFVEEAPLREQLSGEFFSLFTGSASEEDVKTIIAEVIYE